MDAIRQVAVGIALRVVVTIAFFGFAMLLAKAWQRYRRPEWPDTPGNIVIPFGGWIVVFVLVLAFVCLAFAITKDPLAPH